jgi:hypothetical protein
MSVIFHVLKEEFNRLLETESSYMNALAAMPKGTPRFRQIREKKYLYLEYRVGNRVLHDYIGSDESDKTKDILEKVAQRKRYEKLLKDTKMALKDVRKVLRGKI